VSVGRSLLPEQQAALVLREVAGMSEAEAARCIGRHRVRVPPPSGSGAYRDDACVRADKESRRISIDRLFALA